MDLNDKELVKSLTSLIDETLDEIEEIKKSKYAASEIKIEGPGDGIGGKPVNGELDAKKKEDEDEDEEKEEKDEMDKADDCGDMDKGENEKADEDHGKFAQAPSVAKGENEKADEDHGKFAQSKTVAKKEDKEDEEEEDEKKEMKKSLEESESLMKSYVDHKFESLEEKLSKMTEMFEAMADAPVGRKGVPAGVQPLNKSNEGDYETLTKSTLANSLFELKKSGTSVDSSDIFRVETSKNYGELKTIADKYGVK
jgi:hypothetical protein